MSWLDAAGAATVVAVCCCSSLAVSLAYACVYHGGLEKGRMPWALGAITPHAHRRLMAPTLWLMAIRTPLGDIWSIIMAREAELRSRRIQCMNDGEGPPPGSICWLGDSQFNFWHTLERDMSAVALQSYNAGFGGCRLADVEGALQKLCFRWDPAMVVLHVGGNDYDSLSERVPGRFGKRLSMLCNRILDGSSVNQVVILMTAPRPSYTPKKWNFLSGVYVHVLREFGRAVHGKVGVLDSTSMQHEEGDFLAIDGVHLSASGFERLSAFVVPDLRRRLNSGWNGHCRGTPGGVLWIEGGPGPDSMREQCNPRKHMALPLECSGAD